MGGHYPAETACPLLELLQKGLDNFLDIDNTVQRLLAWYQAPLVFRNLGEYILEGLFSNSMFPAKKTIIFMEV